MPALDGVQPLKSPVESSLDRELEYVRFSSATMLWGAAYQYAATGLDQVQGMYGYAAQRIVRTPDEVVIYRGKGKPMAFPIYGSAIACYTYKD